jgi:HPt (histidine-containing phosphotransfer) domain-containing protein
VNWPVQRIGNGHGRPSRKPVNINEMFKTMAKWIPPSHSMKDKPSHATSSAAAELPEEIANLPGIDTPSGLRIVQGNVKLYKKLLVIFHNSYGDFAAEYRAAQAQDEDPQATLRAAHSLKSAAGNIGALAVQEKARQLEFACKDASNNVDELVAAVISELQTVIEGLHSLSTGQPD